MSARVHGTGRDLVAPDWPPLILDEVADVLGHYGSTARRVIWRSPRPLSAAALVATDEATVFVKRHASVVRSAMQLSEEHAFAAHLSSRGIPVPVVLSDNHGRTALADGAWTWEVHAEGTGDDVYREVRSWEPFFRADHAFAAGAKLAEIACAAADFTAPRRQHTLLVTSWDALASADLLTSLVRYVEARPLLAEALAGRPWPSDVERVLMPLHAELVPYLAELPSQWTHGDGHASNFLWRGSDVTAVLDLGLADRGTPILDLATAIERNCISWLDPEPAVRYDLVDALLTGWSSVRPLTPLDRSALSAMLPLAHVEFALSELAYFAGVVHSRPNADLAYEGYLLGHARWFTADAGTELLSRLA